MESNSLKDYVARLDNNSELNLVEESILEFAEKIITLENPALDCSDASQHGAALVCRKLTN